MMNNGKQGTQPTQSNTGGMQPGNQTRDKAGTPDADAKGAQRPGIDAGREQESCSRQPGSSYDNKGVDTRRKGDDVSSTPEETAGRDGTAGGLEAPTTPGRSAATDTRSATGGANTGTSASNAEVTPSGSSGKL